MQKHDKIYIPVNEPDEFLLYKDWADAPPEKRVPLKQENDKIVLTIEELRECFIYGMSSSEDTNTPEQCFNDFLISKGIKP